MRNAEKDVRAMTERRELMLAAGFRIFAERGIETVSMQEIASGLGIATVYRYFSTKLEFVIAIGAKKWREYYDEIENEYVRASGDAMTAAEELEFFIDCIIALYRRHRDVLLFNRNFSAYVMHEGATAAQMRPYNEAASLYAEKFHSIWRKAREDGTLNVNISEKRLFTSTLHIVLSVASKFAEGLVYPDDYDRDMTEELLMLKRMILGAYAAKTSASACIRSRETAQRGNVVYHQTPRENSLFAEGYV